MDHQDRVGLELVKTGCGSDGAARFVHERLRLQQCYAVPVQPHLRNLTVELALPPRPMPARELFDDHPPDVVAVSGVLAAGIAEADDQQIERRGALASTPRQAHQPSLVGSPEAASSPSAGCSAAPSGAASPSGTSPSGSSSPSGTSSGSGSTSRVGAVTVASTVSSGLSRYVTPSIGARSARRSVSPIAMRLTSSSTCSGTSIGSASTLISRCTWESTPPSFTPAGSPTSWTLTLA